MSDGALKLTTYFGERDRTERGLLADELFDIYDRQQLEVSALFRGAEGFGSPAQLQSDRLLSLSQDLPLISIAVDERERIESTLELVMKIKRRGLITLERAQLLRGDDEQALNPDVEARGAKLTIYVGRRQRAGGQPAFVAVCNLLHRGGMAGAIVLLGVDGTYGGRRSRARFFARNSDVPMEITSVGSAETVANVIPELARLLGRPLMTLERVQVCKRDGELLAAPRALPASDGHGRPLSQKLTVYAAQSDTHDRRPLGLQIVRSLRRSDAAGATLVRGIWGFHRTQAPHGDRFFQVARRVPTATIAIDTPEQAARSFAVIDALTARTGLVTSEMVPAVGSVGRTGEWDRLLLADHSP